MKHPNSKEVSASVLVNDLFRNLSMAYLRRIRRDCGRWGGWCLAEIPNVHVAAAAGSKGAACRHDDILLEWCKFDFWMASVS